MIQNGIDIKSSTATDRAHLIGFDPTTETPSSPSVSIALNVGEEPTALAIDRNNGNLLITDNGVNKCVLIYSGLNGTPTRASTFGLQGGINSSTAKGVVADPDATDQSPRFINFAGIGVDSSGNYYVADATGYGLFRLQEFKHSDTPDWTVQGMAFSTIADADLDSVEKADITPTKSIDFYNSTIHYKWNPNNPIGKEWSFYGYTLDKDRFPDDPRIHVSNSTGTRIVSLGGHKLLMSVDAAGVAFYRFEEGSETAIPCVYICGGGRNFSVADQTWPTNAPKGTRYIPQLVGAENWWIWRDRPGGSTSGSFASRPEIMLFCPHGSS